jgi:ribosomal protein S18 acetylase RimI-like enzyme
MNIREMVPLDLIQLQKIYLECRKETFSWMPPESFVLSDFEKDTEGEWILVAEENSKILGFSSVWLQDNFLHHLFVSPSSQSRGIGKSLLSECFNRKLKKPARLKSLIQNTRACRFYEHLGWVIESTSTANSPMGPYNVYLLNP